jgi:hypothetical protein
MLEHLKRLHVLPLVMSMVAGGCATSTMHPPRQLQAGEAVVTVAIDAPGYWVLPRLSGQILYGLGGADVSAYLGTTFFSLNGGAGARLYLNDWLMASLQGNAVLNWDYPVFSVTPRLMTSGQGPRIPYFGLQSNIIWQIDNINNNNKPIVDNGSDEPIALRFFGVNLGPVVGYEFHISGATRMQIELTVSPFVFNPQQGLGIAYNSDFMFFVAQLGIGFSFGGEKPL